MVLNQPLEDSYCEEKLRPDEEIIIPEDDLHTITWGAKFVESRGHAPNVTYLPSSEQPVTSNDGPNDADEDEVDYITLYNNERQSA